MVHCFGYLEYLFEIILNNQFLYFLYRHVHSLRRVVLVRMVKNKLKMRKTLSTTSLGNLKQRKQSKALKKTKQFSTSHRNLLKKKQLKFIQEMRMRQKSQEKRTIRMQKRAILETAFQNQMYKFLSRTQKMRKRKEKSPQERLHDRSLVAKLFLFRNLIDNLVF